MLGVGDMTMKGKHNQISLYDHNEFLTWSFHKKLRYDWQILSRMASKSTLKAIPT